MSMHVEYLAIIFHSSNFLLYIRNCHGEYKQYILIIFKLFLHMCNVSFILRTLPFTILFMDPSEFDYNLCTFFEDMVMQDVASL